jgi:hypothetical protein
MKQISKEDLEKLNHNKQILFACFCAEQVMHLVKESDKEVCLRAIKVAYLFLEGKATKEDCQVAASTAYASAAFAAAYASASAAFAAAAAYAAYAASAAAYAAASASAASELPIITAQWAFYDQLLNGDKYFEEIVLNGNILL